MARAGAYVDPIGTVYPPAPIPIADLSAGMYAALATVAALGRADRVRVHLSIPAMATGLAWLFMRILRELDDPAPRVEPGSGVFEARDGQALSLSAVEPSTWSALVDLLELHDIAPDPDHETFADRIPRASEINRRVAESIRTRARAEWLELLAARDIPVAPANDAKAALEDPVVRALDVIHLEPQPHVAFPVRGIEAIRNVETPALDEHGDAVRRGGWEGLDADA
jgi:crotonobetainyl-CoA:carnitine CoA-transferase CaiB-like acyl-CoA transferase